MKVRDVIKRLEADGWYEFPGVNSQGRTREELLKNLATH